MIYLDSSALLKLVVTERESQALNRHLATADRRSSCALALVEVVRAARKRDAATVQRARALLGGIELIDIDRRMLDRAADLQDGRLRSLDAVHVAAALMLAEDLAELITYDARMADAARAAGLPVSSPA